MRLLLLALRVKGRVKGIGDEGGGGLEFNDVRGGVLDLKRSRYGLL